MPSITPKRWIAELLLLCVAVGWGIGFPVMKLAVNSHPVLMVLGLRFVLSTLILLPLSARKLSVMPLNTLGAGVGLGLLLGCAFIFLISGLQITTASNTGFLSGLSVIWVLLLSGPLAWRLPMRDAVLATFFGLAGLYLMSDLHGWQLQWGDVLVIVGSIFTAIHIMVLDKLSHHHDNMTLTFLQIATMALVIMLLGYFIDGVALPAVWDRELIIALLVTVLFSTAIAFWVQTRYQRYTTPLRAILIYNLEPVFAACFSVWLLHETLSRNVLFGGGLIVLGMSLPAIITLLNQRVSKRRTA